MIQPTEADAGRTVEYRNRHMMSAVPEPGVLVSWNELYAFVRYGRDAHAKGDGVSAISTGSSSPNGSGRRDTALPRRL
jgi:hypothetical protein